MTPALLRLRQRVDIAANDADGPPADALLVTDETNVQYLSGFTGDSTWLLVPRDGDAVLLSDARYQTQLAKQCPNISRQIRGPNLKMTELLSRCLDDLGEDEPVIEFEASDVSVATMEGWSEALPTVRWRSTTGVVEKLRTVKTEQEVAKTQRAIDVAEQAFVSVVAGLDDSMTERQVAHALEAEMRRLGATGASFPPIVGVDAGAALPHYQPSDRSLAGGRVLLIDWGAVVDGYTSDLTRMLCRFGPGDETMRQRFEHAYEATRLAAEAGIAKIAPGIKAADVDAAARSVLTEAGLGEAFKHGLGHGFGRVVHEAPRLGATSTETLAAGMLVTVEPGVYFENDFGIRIEDDVLVTGDGARRLSKLPSGLEACRWVV